MPRPITEGKGNRAGGKRDREYRIHHRHLQGLLHSMHGACSDLTMAISSALPVLLAQRQCSDTAPSCVGGLAAAARFGQVLLSSSPGSEAVQVQVCGQGSLQRQGRARRRVGCGAYSVPHVKATLLWRGTRHSVCTLTLILASP